LSIHVQLERFEGPLGLLLHLIREQEMDIFNINIHQITTQYLEYIKSMRRLDLEVAGEFVAMAETLLHIKSRMLLPQYNEEGEEVQEDPRKDLVQKLLEYQKFKELSAGLYKRAILGRDVFPRGEREAIESLAEGDVVVEDNPLFSLIVAYRSAIKNMKKTVHRVAGELQSIASRILEMKELLVVGQRKLFRDLITDREHPSRQVLVTFLSVLELAKMGFISVFQTEPLSDIYIEPKRGIDRDVVSQVENYDSVNADQAADAIMNQAQLSLDESALSAEDPMGEAPIVQEQEGDAATDDEIEAEERRLMGGVVESPPVQEAPEVEETPAIVDDHSSPVAMEAMEAVAGDALTLEAAAVENVSDTIAAGAAGVDVLNFDILNVDVTTAATFTPPVDAVSAEVSSDTFGDAIVAVPEVMDKAHEMAVNVEDVSALEEDVSVESAVMDSVQMDSVQMDSAQAEALEVTSEAISFRESEADETLDSVAPEVLLEAEIIAAPEPTSEDEVVSEHAPILEETPVNASPIEASVMLDEPAQEAMVVSEAVWAEEAPVQEAPMDVNVASAATQKPTIEMLVKQAMAAFESISEGKPSALFTGPLAHADFEESPQEQEAQQEKPTVKAAADEAGPLDTVPSEVADHDPVSPEKPNDPEVSV